MDLTELKAELLAGHPDTGAYSADDTEAAAQLNVVNRTQPRDTMTGSEVLNSVDTGEWAVIDAAKKQTVWDIVHLGTVDPFGVEETLMIGVFGPGSDTIIALAAARQRAVSRAVEIDLGRVRTNDVIQARAL